MKNAPTFLIRSVLVAATLGLAGCSTYIEEVASKEYLPLMQDMASNTPERMASGSIFAQGQSGLFAADRRASVVGDILTVEFKEKFAATKSQNAATSKASSYSLALPNIAGIAAAEAATGNTLAGTGTAGQSNTLTGQMSVTVVRVFATGNLEILGQKKLTLNNGDEYIRVRGLVRPDDISSSNVILSDRIANAEIKYTGAGDIADTAKQGWLARAFTAVSPL
ncbi:MAG: flagellar basal body L-ring protein FlgH [Paracoccaceae bacterium]